MSTTTIPVHTAAGLLGYALAMRRQKQVSSGHMVCWWSPNGFSLPSCQLYAGFAADASLRCCMEPLVAETPVRG